MPGDLGGVGVYIFSFVHLQYIIYIFCCDIKTVKVARSMSHDPLSDELNLSSTDSPAVSTGLVVPRLCQAEWAQLCKRVRKNKAGKTWGWTDPYFEWKIRLQRF